MQRKKKEPEKNLKLAFLFVVVFLLLLFISIIFKGYFLIKESSFDGKHNFNVEFLSKDSKSIVSFSPQNHSIEVVNSKADSEIPLPIDGIIFETFNKNSLSKTLLKAIFSDDTRRNLTELDLIRLALFSRTVHGDSFDIENLEEADLKSMFKDPAIIGEGKTVEIINSTNVSGLGNKLATELGDIGVNVILVKSEDDGSSKIIVNDAKSYTTKKLYKFLKYPVSVSSKRQIADVIIIIGTDSLKKLSF